MMASSVVIDPLARVEDGAVLGDNVTIGPFCLVGKDVTLGAGVQLQSHVVVEGRTTIGAGTRIGPHTVIGGAPQSLGYKGEDTSVSIGENCIIRENVTVNRGTIEGQGATTIGHSVFMMAGSHVAHDCRVGNHVVFANCGTLGGHCIVGDRVFIGGLAAVHQFTRIGDYAMIGGVTGVKRDVIPYGMAFAASGAAGELIGLNFVGIRRSGVDKAGLRALNQCYRQLFFGEGTFAERLASAERDWADHPIASKIITFITSDKKRPIMMAAQHDAPASSDA